MSHNILGTSNHRYQYHAYSVQAVNNITLSRSHRKQSLIADSSFFVDRFYRTFRRVVSRSNLSAVNLASSIVQFRTIRSSDKWKCSLCKRGRARVLSRFEIDDGNSWTHIESLESAVTTTDAIFVPLEDNNSEERGIEWGR